MKVLAFALALLAIPRQASAACDKTDSECLLRLTLQQTYKLEAEQQRNEMLQQRLESAEQHSQSGAKYFIVGMVVGTIFFGLVQTSVRHL